MINSGLPSFDAFVESEYKTFEFLSSQPSVDESFAQLCADANIAISKRRVSKGISFETEITTCLEGKAKCIHIGETVTPVANPKEYESSGYFAICDTSAPLRVQRKVHFDTISARLPAPSGVTKPTPKPVFHLQVPGTLSTKLGALDDTHLDPFLSTPRLISQPISFALLLHLVLVEAKPYHRPSHDLIEDSGWRGIVIRNEQLLWKPFYENIYNFQRTAGASTPPQLLVDFSYAN